MKTKTYSPLLTNSQYRKLTWPQNVDEWLAAWNNAVESKSLLSMMELLHHGLRQHMKNLLDTKAIPLFVHYLRIADGHRSEQNFGKEGYEQETPLGRMSHAKLLQSLAHKAWQELCNRFFAFRDASDGRPVHFSLMLRPALAEAILDFIDPAIAKEDEFFNWRRWNVDAHPEKPDEDNARALKFAKFYLREIFDFGDDRGKYTRWFYHEDDSNQQRLELGKSEYCQALNYFVAQRPRIIVMMNHYGILKHVANRRLDEASLAQVRKLAVSRTQDGSTPITDLPLEEVAFEFDPEYDHAPLYILTNRMAVNIAMQHPSVVAAHDRWMVKRKQIADEELRREIAAGEQTLSDLQSEIAKKRDGLK